MEMWSGIWAAAGWGAVAGAALLVGAVIALILPVNLRVIGAVMGFGAGVLISAVAFELTTEAMAAAGLPLAGAAMILGAIIYTAGDWLVSNAGAHRRKSPVHGGIPASSQNQGTRPTVTVAAASNTGAVLVVGALLDGIPESAAIGISLLDGGQVGLAFLAAVFLSNVPESWGATSGLRAAGRSIGSILGMWTAVLVASAIAAGVGYAVLGGLGPVLHGGIQAFTAGAVLAMIATTMLPEAVEHAGRLVGLVTVLGFGAAILIGMI